LTFEQQLEALQAELKNENDQIAKLKQEATKLEKAHIDLL